MYSLNSILKQEVLSEHYGTLFYCEGNRALSQVVQGGCGVSILGDIQKPGLVLGKQLYIVRLEQRAWIALTVHDSVIMVFRLLQPEFGEVIREVKFVSRVVLFFNTPIILLYFYNYGSCFNKRYRLCPQFGAGA